MAKKMLFQRRLARKARTSGTPDDSGTDPSSFGQLPHTTVPHAILDDPLYPSPQGKNDLAAGGEPVVRGNSNQESMTPEGHAQMQQAGQALAAQGGPDKIVPGTSKRAMEAATDVNSQSPQPAPVQPSPGLESHALGNAEGSPKTPAMKKLLADLIKKSPNSRIPGQGALSSKPSESWNEFRVRGLTAVRGLMQQLAQNPQQKIVVPTSTQIVKLVKAWVANGHPDDFSISNDEMLHDETSGPGSMYKFSPNQDGVWTMPTFDPKTEPFVDGAIYFLLHGATPSTSAPEDKVSAGQRARAEIVKHVTNGDWKNVQKTASRAASAGHLADPEIDSAIDEALPTAQGARELPPHQLLSAASAANPAKRAELLPVVQERFGNLSGVTPEAAQALRSHLGRIGALPAGGPTA